MAIPGAFSPQEIDGRLLVDGFLTENLPVSVALDWGAEVVIAVDVGAPLHTREALKSLLHFTGQTRGLVGVIERGQAVIRVAVPGRISTVARMSKRILKPRTTDPELARRLQELIVSQGGGHNADLVEDILVNALKLLKDVEHRGDVRVIQTAVRELRYAFRLFAPYEAQRKVTIFGSARTQPDRVEYQQAVEFGRKVAEAGYMVITGAGPGIMQAGHEGAGPDKSFGVNIRLPWEQSANPVISKDAKLVTFKYFFTRKLIFIRHSDAIVLFPGGFGTMDEGYEALTLMQTGKSRLMPLILIDRPGGTYWRTWDRQVREHLLRNELISEDDLNLYQITDDTTQAVKWITRFYRNFHSSRFVRDLLVLRLRRPPPESALEALNEDFADLITGDPIRSCAATPEERDDEDCVDLPRIAFGFNRRDYGRLRLLIDRLNGL